MLLFTFRRRTHLVSHQGTHTENLLRLECSRSFILPASLWTRMHFHTLEDQPLERYGKTVGDILARTLWRKTLWREDTLARMKFEIRFDLNGR